MIEHIIRFSLHNKLLVFLFVAIMSGFGVYALMNIPIGAVPDITNNQVQVITTSRNLATQDVEQFITYPVELEMANLPGVKELRSVSKFGLSVVTIVFEDDMGTYLPRQLIAEKIKTAAEKIPAGFGTPEMGPISTGLGEIYQYILDVKPEFNDKYSTMDLRTIQDWVVKRQLSGIPGVVEVNTWGGFLKQYEVSTLPEKLHAMNVNIQQIFSALETNNSISGGAYIEKTNQSYFIRGEGLVGSLEDIERIVVDNRGGTPILIKDVAVVTYGAANRFGAITANGEGEKVLGQVMMLKDANSGEVINNVKKRVAEIQSSLPEGVFINGFLERSELIAKTTFTITENLILGCLIVILVVVLLLGNFRSGLVVASVIPLSLLFALSMMYIFGVDANLMSLGAIDFGIIIDGAVIIVEYISFQMMTKADQISLLPNDQKQGFIDKITLNSSHKMMRSAVFGQIIIIIVFIPILSLSGVEGKMFKPMAMTFSFALIGAMLLCFTYVPVVSALFIKGVKEDPKNISVRMMAFLTKLYTPTITWALEYKKVVVGLAVAFLILTGILFSTMGGEFVPTLDEGDFVIQPVLKTGTSLSKTIETTTMIESILKEFPEVNQVVSRIGAAEIPTDPMSMEESDIIIKLHPIKTWTTAKTKDELADKFTEALTSKIPGIEYEFTQPIEMRFNELITGVRADLAIKIFGEDLTVLNKKAQQIKKLIDNVEGASDIVVEKVEGLPQMGIVYDRPKIAKYGLDIQNINDIMSMAFAGKISGSVFEGEKRFDLVVRFDKEKRSDIEDIKRIYIPLPNGGQIPLEEVAKINYTEGPAKISRDNTRRRIVIGVNVRNRDLESVVKDVQQIVDTKVDLPTGYSVSYGGQFENLRSARTRLMIAVPIALLLIFVLLYFAFQSVKDALLIYTAIPLSAIGGVLLLWMRDLPFSISAGVGFIALFGIAVLNGIVLIEHFKELKAHGMTDIKQRIILGTQQRLRPVLLTASAAALGFLPMAISTNAGAEVQRPLATVVVGGLITATLLTLIVLPVLYAIFDKKSKKMNVQPMILILILFLFPFLGRAQKQSLTLENAIELAVKNNAALRSTTLMTDQAKAKISSAFDPAKTQFYYSYDQNNLPFLETAGPLHVFGIQQQFSLPTVYRHQKKLYQSEYEYQQKYQHLQSIYLEKEVHKAFETIEYLQASLDNLKEVDSLYTQFAAIAASRYRNGETNLVEKLTAETKSKQIKTEISQLNNAIQVAYKTLNGIIQTADNEWIIENNGNYTLKNIGLQSKSSAAMLDLVQSNENIASQAYLLEKTKLFPDVQLQFFRGSSQGTGSLWGGQIGLGIPLFYKAQKASISSALLSKQISQSSSENVKRVLTSRQQGLDIELEKLMVPIRFYKDENKKNMDLLIKTALTTYQNGESGFMQYLQAIELSNQVVRQYYDDIHAYNLTLIEKEFISLN